MKTPTQVKNQLSVDELKWFREHYPWDSIPHMESVLQRPESTLRKLACECKVQRLPVTFRKRVWETYTTVAIKSEVLIKKSIDPELPDSFLIKLDANDLQPIEINASIFQKLFAPKNKVVQI